MAVKRKQGTINVVQAAEMRVRNVFRNGLPVYMSFSGGKDSLCLANVTLELIQRGEIDPAQLTVQFIDEEAIFPCIEEMTKQWRRKFLMVGAKFAWYCMQYRHFNCFNALENDESFICWDAEKSDRWVRQPPPFAIRNDPQLRERVDSYQQFLDKKCAMGMTMVGVRTAESLQRLQNIAKVPHQRKGSLGRRKIYPIYDWKDSDVWLYLKEHKVDIPDIYLYMWQAGATRRQMRVSQFFSVDTARSLVKMNEYYPYLLDSIIRREPNAYLAALYWDSEMFGRSTRTRRTLEKETEKKDYRAELNHVFRNFDTYFQTKHKRKVASAYRNFYLSTAALLNDQQAKSLYESLMAGDPKLRSLRALYQNVYSKYVESAKEELKARPNDG